MNRVTDLAREIERLRRELQDLLSRGTPVDSQEVMELSRQIDAMVVEYTRLRQGCSK